MASDSVTVKCFDTRKRFYLKLSNYPSGLQLPTDEPIKLTHGEWKQFQKETVGGIALFEEIQIIDDNISDDEPENFEKIEVE